MSLQTGVCFGAVGAMAFFVLADMTARKAADHGLVTLLLFLQKGHNLCIIGFSLAFFDPAEFAVYFFDFVTTLVDDL